MMVEEVTCNILTLVGGADGAEGKIIVCMFNRTHQLLTCSMCSSLEVFCFFLTTMCYRHSDGVLCSFLKITKCIDHRSDRR